MSKNYEDRAKNSTISRTDGHTHTHTHTEWLLELLVGAKKYKVVRYGTFVNLIKKIRNISLKSFIVKIFGVS